MVARGNENRIIRLHHHKVFHPDQRNKLLRTVDIIAMRIERQAACTLGNILIFVRKVRLLQLMLVECSP